MAVSARTWPLSLALLFAVVACVPPPPTPDTPLRTPYSDPHAWLCRPGRSDACTGDLTATEIRPDGTRVVERFVPSASPKADCFYVYPTVDLSLIPKNHDDFSSLAPMTEATLAQVGRFRQSCALYVPLYRQVTIGTYLQKRESREPALALAFADVEAAFAHYLANDNRGRPIILLGHSQGAEMVVRLVRRFFDNDPELRKRLVVVMAIGGDLEAPAGQPVGGTFAHVPACTGVDQTACVVAYRTYARDEPVTAWPNPPHPGQHTLCVNPADLEHDAWSTLAAAYIPVNDRNRRFLKGVDGVTTPFVVLRDFYAGQCVRTEDGFAYFAVGLAGAPGDARASPVDFDKLLFKRILGLHVLDYQLLQGDLLEMVARRVAKLP
jgi:hypothetical protein